VRASTSAVFGSSVPRPAKFEAGAEESIADRAERSSVFFPWEDARAWSSACSACDASSLGVEVEGSDVDA